MASDMTLIKSSKDYYGKQNVTIKIGEEEREIPMSILEDFVKDESKKESWVPDIK